MLVINIDCIEPRYVLYIWSLTFAKNYSCPSDTILCKKKKKLQAIVIFRGTYLLVNKSRRGQDAEAYLKGLMVGALLIPQHLRVLILPRSNLNMLPA